MTKPLNLTGEIFGRLTVIKRVENSEEGRSMWECLCECGNKHVTLGSRLNNGKVFSCGCIQKEAARKSQTKHELSSHPLYHVRKEMLARTTNPNNKRYHCYGALGIKVCKDWSGKENGVVNFYNWAMENGYEEGLSIDRIDVNGNYEPSNCRWTTNDVQANNTRANRIIEYNGKKQNIQQWADELGFKSSLIRDRLKCGWSVERTLTTPSRILRTKNDTLEYNGKGQTVQEWADELGLTFKLILNRLQRGWTVERALTTPKRKEGKKSTV